MSLPWIEKYRPQSLDDLISQEHIVETVRKFIAKSSLPHLLFYGPPGTGKTSAILACAREIYGDSMRSMVLELNASDDRGIDVVRDQVKAFASTRSIFSTGFKLIILDEADSMTSAAQAALRRVIEKYTKNARFCLICNYVNGIIPALQSRCTKFRFSPLQPAQVRMKLEAICKQETGITVQSEAIDALISLSGGDMRRALNVLQAATASFPGSVDAQRIYQVMGVPSRDEIERVFGWLSRENFEEAFSVLKRLVERNGFALGDVVKYLFDYMIDLQIEDKQRIYISKCLATIEHALNKGASEKLQMASLVGCFQLMRLGVKN